MTPTIRPAQAQDRSAIAALLLADAHTRAQLDPALWAVAPDAAARVQAALGTVVDPVTGPMRHHWLVAERQGAIVAVTHGINLPAPPIVDLKDGTAGLLFDDSHLGDDADVARALIAATEAAMREAGAVLFVAASPVGWTARTSLLQAQGYEPTTLYMARTGLRSSGPDGARKADTHDIDGIVALSALARAQLRRANPTFWNIHPQADARFATWMGITLTLPDRTMFVSGPPDRIDGFIIAQPGSPLHLPPAHDIGRIGLIDDFHATLFEPDAAASSPAHAEALLCAAEATFHAKGLETALAICPVRMTGKADFLKAQGYAAANMWMVKP